MAKPAFGDLERAVFDILWAAEPGGDHADGDTGPDDSDAGWLTVRELHEALAPERAVAYTTVMTVMERLARKGQLLQRKEGRAYRYKPRASRSAMISELLHDTLADFSEDDRPSALVAFVQDASHEDVAALRAALDRLDP